MNQELESRKYRITYKKKLKLKVFATYPQEKRHCTIARIPNLGPKTALKTGQKQRDFRKDVGKGHGVFLEMFFRFLSSVKFQKRTGKPGLRMIYVEGET